MKFTFLGTGAAEQYPGLWCTCDYCTKARKLGGKNIRHTSAAHFSDTCLIDFPAENFSQARLSGINLLSAKLLLVTHSHEDHFYPQLLFWRYLPKEARTLTEQEINERGYSRQQELPILHIFGNKCTYEALLNTISNQHIENLTVEDLAIDFTVVRPYNEYQYEQVKFTPMTASHIDRDKEPGLIYIVETEGKTFLYATDSGPYTEETRECIAGHKFDAVIMEETFGYAKGKGITHMSWEGAMEEMKFFEKAGIWKNQPRIYWTHMSPHKTPPHTELEQLLEGLPITPAYDGLKIDI